MTLIVFINTIGRSSPYRWLFDRILAGNLILCISNDIFYKYWEVLERKTTATIADNIANFLSTIPSVKFIEPFIRWNLVSADEEDNKFVDCLVSAGAECIISHDKHFAALKELPFPPVKVYTPEEFEQFYNSNEVL